MAVSASWCTGRKLTLVIAMLFLALHAFTAVRRSIPSYGRLLPVFLLWVWVAKVEGLDVCIGCSGNPPRCPLAIDGTCPSLGDFFTMNDSILGELGCLTFTGHVRCTWTVKSTYREVQSQGASPMSLQVIVGREDFIFQLGMQSCGEWSVGASGSGGFTWADDNFKGNDSLNVLGWCLVKMRGNGGPEVLRTLRAAYLVLIYYSIVVFMPRLA
mmetsp:Transcript_73208/g.122245  ORF Transcript_73208/g.122245 Transcript_73208/m.122245 type:complete len:213 (+) Transcript_73208:1434-2072(+)|eukprot:CAMPEP_0119299002 /NCGR_PEP_ID=MMETSP1333-20130426/1129_1 /TAXON_ID=418940 /ORGANISM="Scyphosphaera apsteinii, Strain RCC1455" /LENGTH=212 /DNA_ID=CAMNT_0007300275 /DNA_START=133 /DNA_END=771 /DNA_ORIENTATION=-